MSKITEKEDENPPKVYSEEEMKVVIDAAIDKTLEYVCREALVPRYKKEIEMEARLNPRSIFRYINYAAIALTFFIVGVVTGVKI